MSEPPPPDERGDPFEVGQPAWWGFHPPAGGARSLVELIAERTLDAELAALLWLLLEARVSVVVAAAPPLAGKTTLLTALLDLLPAGTERVVLRGAAEDFDWLPDAADLGWRRDERDPDASAWLRATLPIADPFSLGARRAVGSRATYLLAAELSAHLPVYTWGAAARTAIRAVGRGYGLGTTIHGDSLEDVLAQLRGPEVRLSEDELSHLGVVLVLRVATSAPGTVRRRVAAAHYLRPLMRDAAGHLQRFGPAVLATWDEGTDEFEHFEWGIAGELAGRLGLRTGDFEREQARRAEYLRGLVATGVRVPSAVRSAIAGYRGMGGPPGTGGG
jgi:hypothetical protein